MISNAVCKEYDDKIGSGTALESHKLKVATAIEKLSKALGGKFLHFYVYGAVEGRTLVFYLSHSAMVMEFKSKKEAILEDMRSIYKREGMNKQLINFTDIRVAIKVKPLLRKESINLERDRSSGGFEVHGEGALAAKFRQISKTIRDNNTRYGEIREEGG